MYGRGFRLANISCTVPGCPSNGPNSAGQYTREAGFLSYYEVWISVLLRQLAYIFTLELEIYDIKNGNQHEFTFTATNAAKSFFK